MYLPIPHRLVSREVVSHRAGSRPATPTAAHPFGQRAADRRHRRSQWPLSGIARLSPAGTLSFESVTATVLILSLNIAALTAAVNMVNAGGSARHLTTGIGGTDSVYDRGGAHPAAAPPGANGGNTPTGVVVVTGPLVGSQPTDGKTIPVANLDATIPIRGVTAGPTVADIALAQRPTPYNTQPAVPGSTTPPPPVPTTAAPKPPAPKTPAPTTAAPKPPAPTTAAPPPAPVGARNAYSTIQAESYDGQSGVQTEADTDGGSGIHVGFISTGDWIRFDSVGFSSTAAHSVALRLSNGARQGRTGQVELRLDSRSNAPIGIMTIPNNGDWFAFSTYQMSIGSVTGVHTVYLTFTSSQDEEFANVNWLTFVH